MAKFLLLLVNVTLKNSEMFHFGVQFVLVVVLC